MMTQELTFLKAQRVFERIARFIEEALRNGLRMDEVERQLKTDLAEAGLAYLEEFVEASGDGDQGETVISKGRTLTRSKTPEPRRYVSIFGELSIPRYVYTAGKKKPIEYSPVEAKLGLPAGEISYVLEDFQQRLCVQSPYGKSTEDLKEILGTGVAVGTAEHMTQQMGDFAQTYRLSALTEEGTPPPEDEAELLVVAADGKGVVMRKTLAERLREEREAARGGNETDAEVGSQQETEPDASGPRPCRAARKGSQRRGQSLAKRRRRGKEKSSRRKTSQACEGEVKKNRKQMAYVGAVYTISPYVRTADQILDEAARRERAIDRPRPQNKHVWGEMTQLKEGELLDGRSKLFVQLAVECHIRDPNHQKLLICLMDGEEPLWSAKEDWLDRGVEILDFFHVLEHLWKMGRIHLKGRKLDDFVEHHARMFLEGKLDYAVRNFKRLTKKWKLRGKRQAEMERGIGYFQRNRERMRYDEYLAKGYPIGSGVAEGTCRNLVKDRMELTGMRWEQRGAQGMIYLRAFYLNNEWRDFITYRIETEQKQLYGKGTAYSNIAPYAQAL
jgi:hypothetical protein